MSCNNMLEEEEEEFAKKKSEAVLRCEITTLLLLFIGADKPLHQNNCCLKQEGMNDGPSALNSFLPPMRPWRKFLPPPPAGNFISVNYCSRVQGCKSCPAQEHEGTDNAATAAAPAAADVFTRVLGHCVSRSLQICHHYHCSFQNTRTSLHVKASLMLCWGTVIFCHHRYYIRTLKALKTS